MSRTRRRRADEDKPALEYYQTPEGNLRIEEATGPVGAWIEVDPKEVWR